MRIEIYDTPKLKASLVCAAKKDVREYLCGVLIEVQAENILLVSADGHRASVILSKFDVDPGAVGSKFIIPREAIESFLKVAGKNSTATIDFETQQEGEVDRVHFSISDNQGHKIEGKALGGRFPDWRSIIPSVPRDSEKGPTVSYNASYVSDFGKIAVILGSKEPIINLTEYCENLFKVDIGNDDFVGVLMGRSVYTGSDSSWLA